MAIKSELPNGADVLDLEAARVARAEARAKSGEAGRYLKLSAGYVELVAEMPISAAFAAQEQDVKGMLSGILADPADVDALLKSGLTTEDLSEISLFISGKSLGESKA